MLKRSEKFPLPEYLQAEVARLSKPLSEAKIKEVRTLLGRVVQSLETETEELVGPNLLLAKELLGIAGKLLDAYPKFSPDGQALAAAAVLYFIKQHDATPDETPIVGFDDDVLVMNHALERLGLHQLILHSQ